MNSITHNNIKDTKGYVVLYGNEILGTSKKNDETIQKFWKKSIRQSIHDGDVTLFKDGKLIRSCWNANSTLLSTNKYKTQYNKY